MYAKNTLVRLLVAVAGLLPVAAGAQTSSVNAFSPYTMYGIGEMNTPGTLPMRSMGGVGVAVREVGDINLLNPASYSISPQKSFLFDFGVEGQNFYNSQQVAGEAKHTAYNTFNIRDIALRFPLTKKLGLGLSLTPYSSVGYRMRYDHPYSDDDPVWGNVGSVQYNYQGEGDVTEVKLGIGWEVFKNFSIGIAAQYYWGDIDRDYVSSTASITGSDGTYSSIVGNDNYSISSFKGQMGLQWVALLNQKRALTFGATFDFGGDLRPRVSSTLTIDNISNTVVRDDRSTLKLVLPHQFSVGAYYQTSKWALGADYVYQNWGGRNGGVVHTGVTGTGDDRHSYEVAYTNTSTIKLGAEFTPGRYDVRHFFNRCSYRAGFRYGTFNQTFDGHRLGEWAVTAGVGIPVQFLAVSGINVGVEYGRRGYDLSKSLGLVRQQYFKFAIGFSLFGAGGENKDYWFLRPKYD